MSEHESSGERLFWTDLRRQIRSSQLAGFRKENLKVPKTYVYYILSLLLK